MKQIKILNICSSIGNIGDDASHVGLKRILKQILPRHSLTKYDIRNFYASEPSPDRKIFDEEMASYINKFDLCIMGGGAFLDYPISNSVNGPTIDLTDNFLKKLDTKTIIASVSCRPKALDYDVEEKMKKYLRKLQNHKDISLLFRNDGSLCHLRKTGFDTENISEILDNGFFLRECDLDARTDPGSANYCCINVVHDQLSFYGNKHFCTDESYYKFSADLIRELEKVGFDKIIMVPHIYQDYIAITEVLKKLDRRITNNKIVVLECSQGERNAMKTFGVYNNSIVNIGTRFHTNVCSFTLGKPTIPIAFTGRLKALCESLQVNYSFSDILSNLEGVLNNCIEVDKPRLANIIASKKTQTLKVYRESLSEFV